MLRAISAAVFSILLVTSALAAAGDGSVDSMPPNARAEFDTVMSGLFHQDCECWRFIFEGKIKEIHGPMNDDLRWSILKLIEIKEIIPIKPEGSGT